MGYVPIGPKNYKKLKKLPPPTEGDFENTKLEGGSFINLPLGWEAHLLKTETVKCDYCGSINNTKLNCINCGAHP